MDLTIEDVRQLTFELWLARREAAAARAEADELRRLLDQMRQQTGSESDPQAGV